jgi:hypothetical protein
MCLFCALNSCMGHGSNQGLPKYVRSPPSDEKGRVFTQQCEGTYRKTQEMVEVDAMFGLQEIRMDHRSFGDFV